MITRAKVRVVLLIPFRSPLTFATDLPGDDCTQSDSLIRTSRAPHHLDHWPQFPMNTVDRHIIIIFLAFFMYVENKDWSRPVIGQSQP